MAAVNKRAVAAAFGRAATHYSQHDALQRYSAELLLRRLQGRTFSAVLDAGCGPGSMSRYWRDAGSDVTALDLSVEMLAQAQRLAAAFGLGDQRFEGFAVAHDGQHFVFAALAVAVAAGGESGQGRQVAGHVRHGRRRLSGGGCRPR